MKLDDIQKLLTLTDQFKQIKRVVLNVGQDSRENDAEHSYELAILCWFLVIEINKTGVNLNLEKVLTYALAHDLVEAYAGDTDAFDLEAVKSKHERESQAIEKLQTNFQYFPDMLITINNYENQVDPESIFVKSVDKIQPVLNNMRDNGKSWNLNHQTLTFENLCNLKESTIKDKNILDIWNIIKTEIQLKGLLK